MKNLSCLSIFSINLVRKLILEVFSFGDGLVDSMNNYCSTFLVVLFNILKIGNYRFLLPIALEFSRNYQTLDILLDCH